MATVLVQDAAWACLQATPTYDASALKQLTKQDLLDFFSDIDITWTAAVETTLTSTSPPKLDDLKAIDLPAPDTLRKIWAIYLIILEVDSDIADVPPLVYIGSGTHSRDGVQARMRNYDNGTSLPREVQAAMNDKFYRITHKGILCSAAIPEPDITPTARACFLILEAVFSFRLWAIYETLSYRHRYAYSLVPWELSSREYRGCVTHNPMRELNIDGLTMTAEQLNIAAQDARKRRAEMKTLREQRFRQKRALSPTRAPEWAEKKRKVANNTVNQMKHPCTVCNIGCQNPAALRTHMTSKTHLKMVAAGGRWVCGHCEMPFVSAISLSTHIKKRAEMGECPGRGRSHES